MFGVRRGGDDPPGWKPVSSSAWPHALQTMRLRPTR
jgi:hypothetical protein